MKKKLLRGSYFEYTLEEREEIYRAKRTLQAAENALRAANQLWAKTISRPGPGESKMVAAELGKKESFALAGHRIVQHARHIRWEARRHLRLAYGQYTTAVSRPIALKRMGKAMSSFLLERMNQPSFAEQLFPVIPVGLSLTPAQLCELGGITPEQESELSKKWFASWPAVEQLFKDMKEYAVRTGKPVITVDQAYLESIREKEPTDGEEE